MSILAKTLFKGNSVFNGEVKVIENFGLRRIVASGFTQSRSINEKGNLEFYWGAFVDSATDLKKDSKVLILGLGGGTTALALRRLYPTIEIDGVEIDPLMIELGKKYLDLDSAKVNIFIEDGRELLNKKEKKYDLVFVDMFVGGKIADEVLEDDFYLKLKDILNEQGKIVLNKIYEKRSEVPIFEQFVEKHFKIYDKQHSPRFSEPGNIILTGGIK